MPVMGSEDPQNLLKVACTLRSGALLQQLCLGRGTGRFSATCIPLVPRRGGYNSGDITRVGGGGGGALSRELFFGHQSCCQTAGKTAVQSHG